MRRLIFVLFFVIFVGVSAHSERTQVLTLSDQSLYQEIFKLQKKERWKEADKKIAQLQDKLLMGHVLANRYFSVTYRTKASEIEKWFKLYGDHPQAIRMYALGQKKNAKLPRKKPKPLFGNSSGTCSVVFRSEPIDSIEYLSFSYLGGERRKTAQKTMRQIVKHIKAGQTLNAKRLIYSKEAKNLFNKRDHDAAHIALAFSYFLDGMDDRVVAEVFSVKDYVKAIESGVKFPLFSAKNVSYAKIAQLYRFPMVAVNIRRMFETAERSAMLGEFVKNNIGVWGYYTTFNKKDDNEFLKQNLGSTLTKIYTDSLSPKEFKN